MTPVRKLSEVKLDSDESIKFENNTSKIDKINNSESILFKEIDLGLHHVYSLSKQLAETETKCVKLKESENLDIDKKT